MKIELPNLSWLLYKLKKQRKMMKAKILIETKEEDEPSGMRVTGVAAT